MDTKHQLNRFLLSRFDKRELFHRLTNFRQSTRFTFLDLDGTIHRGLCYRFWKGKSNIDLALFLNFSLLVEPVLLYSHCVRLAQFKQRIKEYPVSENALNLDQSSMDIQEFIKEVLRGLPYLHLQKAATQVCRLAFSGAAHCIQTIARYSTRSVLISRALIPVLEAYANRFNAEFGVHLSYFGNDLLVQDGKIESLNPHQSVLTAVNKMSVVEMLLRPLRGEGEAVIIANGYEDLLMFEIADELLGSDYVLKIAMMRTSKDLRDKADVIATSWKGLSEILSSRNLV